MQITVVNKYKCDDPNAIYIGRGSPLGNPFTVEQYGRGVAIEKYKPWLRQQLSQGNPTIIAALDDIANRAMAGEDVKLKCFCKPKPCHGDYIRELVLETIRKSNA